jgi:hypothetical protein
MAYFFRFILKKLCMREISLKEGGEGHSHEPSGQSLRAEDLNLLIKELDSQPGPVNM